MSIYPTLLRLLILLPLSLTAASQPLQLLQNNKSLLIIPSKKHSTCHNVDNRLDPTLKKSWYTIATHQHNYFKKIAPTIAILIIQTEEEQQTTYRKYLVCHRHIQKKVLKTRPVDYHLFVTPTPAHTGISTLWLLGQLSQRSYTHPRLYTTYYSTPCDSCKHIFWKIITKPRSISGHSCDHLSWPPLPLLAKDYLTSFFNNDFKAVNDFLIFIHPACQGALKKRDEQCIQSLCELSKLSVSLAYRTNERDRLQETCCQLVKANRAQEKTIATLRKVIADKEQANPANNPARQEEQKEPKASTPQLQEFKHYTSEQIFAAMGSLSLFREFLKQNPSSQYRYTSTAKGETCLHLAAKYGHTRFLNYFWEQRHHYKLVPSLLSTTHSGDTIYDSARKVAQNSKEHITQVGLIYYKTLAEARISKALKKAPSPQKEILFDQDEKQP